MRESEGFRVRPLSPDDTESFYAAVRESIDELSFWMPWCRPSYGLQDAEEWIRFCQRAWVEKTEFPLGVFEVVTGRLVGGTGIHHINNVYRIGNIGYWTSTSFTGKGVARAAARMAADIGFNDLGLTRLEIVILTQNKASQRVAEAIGARRECIARNRLYFQGKPHEAVVYSLVPEDLRGDVPSKEH
jgi:RimJ/RimL family protein N-acetyltransferase